MVLVNGGKGDTHMAYITYENTHNPHITIHNAGCGQIKKRGGVQRYNQGKYGEHNVYDDAVTYAERTRLPIIRCSFCNPP